MDRSKIISLSLLVVFLFSFAAAEQSFTYPGQNSGSDFESDEWFQAPTYDSQQELLFEILAPFAFVTIILQFSLKKALRMTFAQEDDNPFTGKDKPKVHKEATMMSVAISAMLLASPYWSLIRKMAASIGLLSVAMLGLMLLYLAYLFINGG